MHLHSVKVHPPDVKAHLHTIKVHPPDFKAHLHTIKVHPPDVKAHLHGVKVHPPDVKVRLHSVKVHPPDVKVHLHSVKVHPPDVKAHLHSVKVHPPNTIKKIPDRFLKPVRYVNENYVAPSAEEILFLFGVKKEKIATESGYMIYKYAQAFCSRMAWKITKSPHEVNSADTLGFLF